jgi:hypothetical protein
MREKKARQVAQRKMSATIDPRTLEPRGSEQAQREKRAQREFERIVRAVRTEDDQPVELGPSLVVGAGTGLFAKRAIGAGDAVTEYAGKLVSKDEARNLQRDGRATHVVRHVQGLWALDGLRTPDGTPMTAENAEQLLLGRGLGAFANDARFPNAVYDFVDSAINVRAIEAFQSGRNVRPLPDERITYLRALRPIAAGDEIFVSYGAAYWSEQADRERA